MRVSILDKPLSRGKGEVSLNAFSLLFSEIVQYSAGRVLTVTELQNRLHDLGYDVGIRVIDLYFVRERNSKRETKMINILLFVKTTLWKCLFGKEADKVEHANDEECTYYILEKEPLVNKYISVPKDKGSLNCASFTAGIIEAVLVNSGYVSGVLHVLECQLIISSSPFQPCKVTAHFHKGTTYMVKFESVVNRDRE